ncbi:unnamed protein product [Penicillium nalgiovense]|uniref:B30.2/SPRY domain-containing protein n=1 Tax=Penicillium nalgiovense TaxID=60175 RepID=A0A9W4IE19_PENNA|nr:unnamed protein product [Penicillium nalgiovense]CAG8185970.1 unnamed protein product [Penicillium nalgiovense]CAG8230696.1 unnamed protein product [Penicillium nalgiovense]CAG8255123.1 unnamed protein product [Penicillium nalgiovense]CAG8260987.1 unnamed protein product [Penicillium nalgiovense]
MTFSIFLLLASVYIRAALGGSLTVIDYDRQCVIWSDDNYGCTGHSSSFGLLDGDDCSDLSMITHGIRKDYSKLDVGVCGSTKDNIMPVAWIDINENGMVKFYNQNGDETGCTLDNGFKVGSSCIASDLSSPSSSAALSESAPSTSESSLSASESSSSSESSLSAWESSSSSESTPSISASSPSSTSASSSEISSCTNSG